MTAHPEDRDSPEFLTVAEIAARWKVSLDFVRRLFERESGVLVFSNTSMVGKRRYRTLRVPKAVVERAERRNAVIGQSPNKERENK